MKSVNRTEHGFYLSMSGLNKDELEKHKAPTRSRHILFLLCQKGHVHVTINSREYRLEEKNLFSSTPYDLIQVNCCSPDVQCEVIWFSIDFIHNLSVERNFIPVYCNMIYNHILALDTTEYDLIAESILHLKKIFQITGHSYSHIIKYNLIALVYGVNELYKRKKQEIQAPDMSRSREIYYDFLQLVVQNYLKQQNLNFYADKLYISVKHLMTCVKNSSGRNATSIINKFILLEATSQLDSSNKTVQQIGDDLGFATSSSFCKYFKKHLGMSPRKYRFNQKNPSGSFSQGKEMTGAANS